MKSLSQIPNWHIYVYAILVGFLAVCAAVVSGTLAVPPGLAGVAPYAGFAVIFLTAFLPRAQTATGPGAVPLISPPAKPPDDPNALHDGHEIPHG